MEKFIYRLAIVTLNDVEEMLAYYFEDEVTALGFAELYVREYWSKYTSLLEVYNLKKNSDLGLCKYYREYKCSAWYRFDFLYKDDRVSFNKYLAITRIKLLK